MIDHEPTNFEEITGSLPAGLATNTFATLAATSTPLAVFVPFLLQSLATGRHTKRVDNALKDINEILSAHEKDIKNLTDNQFKIINEVVASIFQTTNEDKIGFLKSAIKNTITEKNVAAQDVDYISRVIRDISVEEINFIIKNFGYPQVFIGDGETSENGLVVKPNSKDEIIVSGLINMGLLYTKTSLYGAISFEYSPVVVKIITLLSK